MEFKMELAYTLRVSCSAGISYICAGFDEYSSAGVKIGIEERNGFWDIIQVGIKSVVTPIGTVSVSYYDKFAPSLAKTLKGNAFMSGINWKFQIFSIFYLNIVYSPMICSDRIAESAVVCLKSFGYGYWRFK